MVQRLTNNFDDELLDEFLYPAGLSGHINMVFPVSHASPMLRTELPLFRSYEHRWLT
jgi:hypothetical protein